jgi:hypothetical protein
MEPYFCKLFDQLYRKEKEILSNYEVECEQLYRAEKVRDLNLLHYLNRFAPHPETLFHVKFKNLDLDTLHRLIASDEHFTCHYIYNKECNKLQLNVRLIENGRVRHFLLSQTTAPMINTLYQKTLLNAIKNELQINTFNPRKDTIMRMRLKKEMAWEEVTLEGDLLWHKARLGLI